MNSPVLLLGLGGMGLLCMLCMCMCFSALAYYYYYHYGSIKSPNNNKGSKPDKSRPTPNKAISPTDLSGNNLLKLSTSSVCIKNVNFALLPDTSCNKSDGNYVWGISNYPNKEKAFIMMKNTANNHCVYSNSDNRFGMSNCVVEWTDQQWVPYSTSNGKIKVKSVHSNKCLSLSADNKTIVHDDCTTNLSNIEFEAVT